MAGHGLVSLGLLAVFVSVTVLVLVVGRVFAERRQVERSLESVRGMRTVAGLDYLAPAQIPFSERIIAPTLAALTRLVRRVLPSTMAAKLAHRLDMAGNPRGLDVDRMLAYKAVGLIVGVGAGFLFGRPAVGKIVLIGLAAGAAGFYLPDLLVYNMGIKRQQLIRKTLADALDMLTISVEAGLGFDAALSQVAKNTEGPLAGEFFRVLQEMQIGKGRTDAFRAVLDRTDVEELRSFISAIIQADTFGIPIAKVLRTQAAEMRLKRRQRAEEQAQKVPVKMMVPLVLCILPSLFTIVIGPGALAIMHAFSHK